MIVPTSCKQREIYQLRVGDKPNRRIMAAQSKLVLLPDELLLLILYLLPFNARKSFTVHPYTAICIKSLTLQNMVISDDVWTTVTTMQCLDTLRLHSVQFANTISPNKVVQLQRVCVAGSTNFRPVLTFIVSHLRRFWYLEIHGYNACTFRDRENVRTSLTPSDGLMCISVNGAIGRACATLPNILNLSTVTTLDINVRLGAHLIQMTLDAVAATLTDLVLRNIGRYEIVCKTDLAFSCRCYPPDADKYALTQKCMLYIRHNILRFQ